MLYARDSIVLFPDRICHCPAPPASIAYQRSQAMLQVLRRRANGPDHRQTDGWDGCWINGDDAPPFTLHRSTHKSLKPRSKKRLLAARPKVPTHVGIGQGERQPRSLGCGSATGTRPVLNDRACQARGPSSQATLSGLLEAWTERVRRMDALHDTVGGCVGSEPTSPTP